MRNLSRYPYISHANVFTQCLGWCEQQFYLWVNPTMDFHKYSMLWTSNQIMYVFESLFAFILFLSIIVTIQWPLKLIWPWHSCNFLFIFSVDGTPIQVFNNRETELGKVDINCNYPKSQAIRVYSILWNGYEWETRGGLVNTN